MLLFLASGTRRRERAVAKLMLDDDTAQVEEILGRFRVDCPTGNLIHLLQRFPGGTPRVTAEQTVATLREQTARRWIYPARRRDRDCTPNTGDIEVGFDRRGHVIWYVPVLGKHPLVLPEQTPD